MASRDIKIELSTTSISKAIAELNAYKKSLEWKCDEIARILSADGVSIAKVNIANLRAIDTGALISSVQSLKVGRAVYMVQVTDESAVYVEFGTGFLGDYPYEIPSDLQSDYSGYVTGQYILANLKNGMRGWYFLGEDGKTHWVEEGMKSRPFMHNTAVELTKRVAIVVKEVFG